MRLLDKFKTRIKDRVGRDSDEGRVLRALAIRVAGRPGWDASSIDLFFLFILHEDECKLDTSRRDSAVQGCIDQWMDLVKVAGRFRSKTALATTLDRMTATDYISSDPLDLDHLSPRGE